MSAANRLATRLAHNAGAAPAVLPSTGEAHKLLARLAHVPFFAHSYPFILNMDHARFSPVDMAEFAYRNELDGLCLHINDGDDRSVARMTSPDREDFRQLLDALGLKLHLEISSTEREEVALVTQLARELGVQNVRFYARRQGALSAVLGEVYDDLCYAAELANKRNLHFDYEQHEDLRAAEIAGLMHRIADPRLNVLFDYTNSWNAYEEPLDALDILRPWIRQVHIKGGHKSLEPDGWGQIGVPQGDPEDELPSARLLYELVMLGDDRPQVLAFALENEVGYVAPPFRGPGEGDDPLIAPRAPSQTLIPEGVPLERRLRDELRWAQQQVTVNRLLVGELADLARQIVDDNNQLGRMAPGV